MPLDATPDAALGIRHRTTSRDLYPSTTHFNRSVRTQTGMVRSWASSLVESGLCRQFPFCFSLFHILVPVLQPPKPLISVPQPLTSFTPLFSSTPFPSIAGSPIILFSPDFLSFTRLDKQIPQFQLLIRNSALHWSPYHRFSRSPSARRKVASADDPQTLLAIYLELRQLQNQSSRSQYMFTLLYLQ